MFKRYIIILVIIGCKTSVDKSSLKNDSIEKWIFNSKNKKISLEKRKNELSKVYQVINSESIYFKYLPIIAYRNLVLRDTLLFLKQNREVLKRGLKIKDSLLIGYSHRNYGIYYRDLNIYDSSFYYFHKASKILKAFPDKKAKMILEKSNLYNELFELNKSEEYCIKALKIFNQTDDEYQVQSCYINLGVILKEAKDYSASLKYYKKALKYKNKNGIYNNIGVVYRNMQDYEKAIFYYKKELSNSISRSDYARTINNLANVRILKGDTSGVYSKIKESLFIKDSLNSKSGILYNYISFRNYYIYSKDTLKVNFYLEKIKDLSIETKNSKEYLSSLLFLAKYKTENKHKYLEKHIKYKDSITQEQNKYLKKFARYSYETDVVIAENNSLKQYLDYFIYGGVILVLFFMFFSYVNKIKTQNEKLLLENDQQKLDEELYLSSIEHQQNLKTLLIDERNRIAEDLHDNILSKLFGIRIKFGFFPVKLEKDKQKEYEENTKELQILEKDIRDVSHQLHKLEEPYAINFEDGLILLLEDKKKIGGFEIEFNKEETIHLDDLCNLTKINLYRIFQEILQNIIKHAKADLIIITMNIYKGKLQLLVQDNGVGFDANKVKKGLGIKTIKSRVKKIKGKISFNNKKNIIKITFPYIENNEKEI